MNDQTLFPRHISETILGCARNFPIVLLLGARQVGKTTLLRELFPDYEMITFDAVNDIYHITETPDGPDHFLRQFSEPVIFDEVQFVPELLSAIKRFADQGRKNGRYLLTGSQNVLVLKRATEGMTGRVAIIDMMGLTPAELVHASLPTWLGDYLENPNNFAPVHRPNLADLNLYETLWRGPLPKAWLTEKPYIEQFHSSYLSSYVERDIRNFEPIEDLHQFGRFMIYASYLTGQEMNRTHFGREIGLSPQTVHRWFSHLTYTYLWFQLDPYYRNAIKRISKKPKGYFLNTGLLCHLQQIHSPLSLSGHPQRGAIFETFCIAMIRSYLQNLRLGCGFYYWRTNNGAEIDLIIERDSKLYPIEFKCKSHITPMDARAFGAFRECFPHASIQHGLIIYAGDRLSRINDNVTAVPWNYLGP